MLVFLLAACFSLTTWLEPRRESKLDQLEPSGSVLGSLLGDGKKFVADYFNTQADVYFHSGYYPSFFQEARAKEKADYDVGHPEEGSSGQEEKGFMGAPLDWIDAFSRHFRPSRHTHLQGDAVGEMLPWMKLSAELDPHHVQTYLVAAYWLRRSLHKSADAEDFIREGLRANPHSPDLLFTLGQIYLEDRKDYPRAKNLFVAALRCWHERDDSKPEVARDGGEFRDYLLLERILGGLIKDEMAAGHPQQALEYMKTLKENASDPKGVQKQIDALQAKLHAGAGQTNQPFGR
jgi:tetratricopeptide (TPR) repeat protein